MTPQKNFQPWRTRTIFPAALKDRVRSYLDANCAQCHRPNGTVANFDARYDTPLAEQGIVSGHVLIDQRIDGARVVAPNDLWRSILLMAYGHRGRLPDAPLARNTVDERGVKMLREWIASLPGPRVLSPPEILPPGGNFSFPGRSDFENRTGGKNLLHAGWNRTDNQRPDLSGTVHGFRSDHCTRKGV